ncbi:hypothetical protein BRD18_04020 [Halobacteriales archaeon SW_7_71_33]|nr:MAG: hypothetical protein BRD18_04020 [Halobacteriales archaeon SW_7_71_33]
MSLFDGRRHRVLAVATVASTLLTVAVGGYGLGVGLLALLSSGSLVAALSALLPWAVGAVVLSLVSALFSVWTVAAALRRFSLPTDDRLAALARRAEAGVPGLRSLDLAERFEPTPEERRRRLKEAYVDGEITEAEFERAVREHVDPDRITPTEDPLLAAALDEETTDGDPERTAHGRDDSDGPDSGPGPVPDAVERMRGTEVEVEDAEVE